MYQDQLSRSVQPVEETELPESARDRILLHTAESMAELPDNCIHLMITSPPYNVLKEYDEDLSLTEYLAILRAVFKETCRVLSAGGRACNNITNLGRKPYLPMHAFIIEEMLNIGFLMRGEVLWDKGASAASSTAWGTWLSAKNPVLRDAHEYILIFSKQAYGRQSQENHSTLEKAEFLAWTKSIWTFPTASARSISHPAPFPEVLLRRPDSPLFFQRQCHPGSFLRLRDNLYSGKMRRPPGMWGMKSNHPALNWQRHAWKKSNPRTQKPRFKGRASRKRVSE